MKSQNPKKQILFLIFFTIGTIIKIRITVIYFTVAKNRLLVRKEGIIFCAADDG